MNRDQLQIALNCDIFGPGFDEFLSHNFEDKIVLNRVGGECHCCKDGIQPKTLIRTRKDLIEGKFYSFRWCNRCTELMAKTNSSDHDVLCNAMDEIDKLYESTAK